MQSPVSPLALPEVDKEAQFEQLAKAAAVQLFAERARAVEPGFALTASTAPLVADVCRRLDGLPLAIELAAARLTHLSLPALRERLERRLPLLTGGGGRPDRHRNLRSTIAWSHDLLSDDEQTLFRRLAVFVSGFALGAVEWVMGVGEWVMDESDTPPPLPITHHRRPEGTRPITRHPPCSTVSPC